MLQNEELHNLILLKKCFICNEKHYARNLCKKCYMSEWRTKNEKHVLEYNKKNHERTKLKNRLYIRGKRKDHEYRKKEYQWRVEKYHSNSKFRMKDIEKARKWQTINPKRYKENKRRWKKNNPRSIKHKNDILMVLNMNNVRKRDNNTCKWHECRLTYKKTTIHVHHIFPQSEYPQYKYEEKYMICYCKKHHQKWHESRNDPYWRLIK